MKNVVTVSLSVFLALTGVLLLTQPAPASLRGATGILQDILGIRAGVAVPGEEAKDDLASAVQDYEARVMELAPEEAAREWLSLYDRWRDQPGSAPSFMGAPSGSADFSTLMQVLPPPASWPALARRIEERPEPSGAAGMSETALRVMAATLIKDYDRARDQISRLAQGVGAHTGWQRQTIGRQVRSLSQAVNAITGDPDRLVREFADTIREQEANPRERTLDIPDLVTLAGEEEAKPLIRRAMKLPRTLLRVPLGDDTLALTQQLALEMVDDMETPQWSLVSTLDALALYEAISARFGADPAAPDAKSDGDALAADYANVTVIDGDFASDFDVSELLAAHLSGPFIISANVERAKRQADMYYILGLMVANRTEEATRAAIAWGERQPEYGGITPALLRQLERAGYLVSVYDFIRSMLERNPELHYWNDLITMGARSGRPDETRDFVLRTFEREDLNEPTRRRLQAVIYRAQLSADEIEDGVARLRQLLDWTEDMDSDEAASMLGLSRADLAVQLATIGHLLEHAEWLEEGLATARMELAREAQASRYAYHYKSRSILEILLEAERYREAEDVLSEQLLHMERSAQGEHSFVGSTFPQSILAGLAEVYVHAGRTGDILVLLDEFPNWGVDDLAACFEQRMVDMPLGYSTATALHRAGRDEAALELLEAVLNREGGYDPAYELYVRIQGADALPFLDALFLRDQFEERPLIWKAHVLRLEGRLDEAEAAAARAISIDPSDGEQGRGRRMRVYAEMGEIERARGNDEQAEFFADVIRAIRLAEDADRIYEAGMFTRGIAMYRDALDFFADAYCIQSRMAIQLEAAGDYAAAEHHYRRAYELMPDSFGRVESHCFGCEGVFDSPRAQGIAERVFTDLYERLTDKPQVPYLLGYLRYSQREYEEAAGLFREALAMDPDYLNAWKKLGDIGRRLQLSAQDRDAVALNRLRLDPNQRHDRVRLEHVYDLAALWKIVEQSAERIVTPPDALYRLEASARASQQQTRDQAHAYRHYFPHAVRGTPESPQQAIAQQAIIREVMQLILALSRA